MHDVSKNRKIIILDSSLSLSNLTDYEKSLMFEVYQNSKHIIKVSDKVLKTITEEELFKWCYENLDDDCWVSFLVGEKGNMLGHFMSEYDAFAFKMRWM